MDPLASGRLPREMPGGPFCTTHPGFTAEMKWVFDRLTHDREAARELLKFHRGDHSVCDFTITFQRLALSAGWDTQAQFDTFYNGLVEEIKDELSSR